MHHNEQMDMMFDTLLRVVREFASADYDLDRAQMSWVIGQLRREMDEVNLDFEAELDDDSDSTSESA